MLHHRVYEITRESQEEPVISFNAVEHVCNFLANWFWNDHFWGSGRYRIDLFKRDVQQEQIMCLLRDKRPDHEISTEYGGPPYRQTRLNREDVFQIIIRDGAAMLDASMSPSPADSLRPLEVSKSTVMSSQCLAVNRAIHSLGESRSRARAHDPP